MVALSFFLGSLVVGLILYLPFFLWFRSRRPKPKPAASIATDLEVSLHMAFVEARTLRYQTLSAEQLLLALLDNPRIADVLRACAIDIEALRADVSATVRDATPVAAGNDPIEPAPTPQFQRVIQRAIQRVTMVGQAAVQGGDVLVALLQEAEGAAVEALQRHGVTRLAVTTFIAHGKAGSGPVVLPAIQDGTLAVVLENDDFTPMEFVIDVLREHLGLDAESALRVMLEVHREGRAVACCLPADVAVDKAERLRSAARQAGHPLKVVVEEGIH